MKSAKIRLSEEEQLLVCNGDWILTKNRVLDAVSSFLADLQAEQARWLRDQAPGLPPSILTIPAKVSKDVVKKMNNAPADLVELYYAILNLVPPIYFEARKKTTTRVDGDKQIILSCFLKGE